MRDRNIIETDGKRVDLLTLEVLLDIRELLIPKEGKIIPKPYTGKPRGRPKKAKRGDKN